MTLDQVPVAVVAIPAACSVIRDGVRVLFLWGVFRRDGREGLTAAVGAFGPTPTLRSRARRQRRISA